MTRLRLLLALVLLAGLASAGVAAAQWRAAKVAGLEAPPMASMIAVNPGEPETLLLFGDSRIAQWAPLPARPYAIVRAGFPGETAIRLQARLPAALQAHRPAAVVLQMGVNDAVAGALVLPERRAAALADSLSALERMTAEARAGGAEVMLMRVVPPVRPGLVRRVVYRDAVEGYVAALNEALPGIAARHGAVVVDPMAVLAGGGADVPDAFRRDALHFTPEAYAALGTLLPATIGTAG
jgi:lysophospholipase L1-like esterase